jgi:hypothetical protein
MGFELTTLVVIGADCLGCCKYDITEILLKVALNTITLTKIII